MRQPPDRSASGCSCIAAVEPEPGEDPARTARRRVGADLLEPGLDLGRAQRRRIGRRARRIAGVRSRSAASTVSYGVASPRRPLREKPDAVAARQQDGAVLRFQHAADQVEQRRFARRRCGRQGRPWRHAGSARWRDREDAACRCGRLSRTASTSRCLATGPIRICRPALRFGPASVRFRRALHKPPARKRHKVPGRGRRQKAGSGSGSQRQPALSDLSNNSC